MGSEITRALDAMGAGNPDTSPEDLALIYHELRRIAGAQMRHEKRAHTLQPTALVHEAYLRLTADPEAKWASRSQFFAAAATAMRRILVEHARKRCAKKRGGGLARVTIAVDELAAGDESDVDVLMVDEALAALERQDARKARLVELRFFAGLELAEAAAALGVSRTTAKRDWSYAKAWLYRRIAGEEPPA